MGKACFVALFKGFTGVEVGTVDLSSSDEAMELVILYLNTISRSPSCSSHAHHQLHTTDQTTTPATVMPNAGEHSHADPAPDITQHSPPHLSSAIRQILSSLNPDLRETFLQNCESHGFQMAIEQLTQVQNSLLAAVEKELDTKALVGSLIDDAIPVFEELRDVVGEFMTVTQEMETLFERWVRLYLRKADLWNKVGKLKIELKEVCHLNNMEC